VAVMAMRRGPSGGDGREDGVVPRHSGDGRAAWTRAVVTVGRTTQFPGAAMTDEEVTAVEAVREAVAWS
jgi:hypothetical protein